MSSRRLPVIIFVSLIEFMIMFMLCVARSAFGGRRRLLHCLRAIARLPLRLGHSHLCLLLLPRCSLRNPGLSYFSYLMFPIYDAYSKSSVCFYVGQLSLCVNYTTVTVDGFCTAYFHLRYKIL